MGGSTSQAVRTGPVTARLAQADPQPIAPGAAPVLPATVRNSDGTSTTVADVDRIVALDRYGSYGTTVFALGLGGRLVGRDVATAFPAARAVTNLTVGGAGVNTEALLTLRPTVVLLDASLPKADALRERLTGARIPVVWLASTRTVETTRALIENVATALGVPDLGRRLADRTQAQIDEAKGRAPTGRRLRVAFVYARGTGLMMVGGPGSGADSLIGLVGGEDAGVAAGLPEGFTPVTAEGMIAARPDVLLMMTAGLSSIGGPEGLGAVPGLAQTPAGRDRRVVDMADAELLAFGPRTGEVALALATALYGS